MDGGSVVGCHCQFFNFHNELAYMEADKHAALGYANYAFFCCTCATNSEKEDVLRARLGTVRPQRCVEFS